jgi:hypothetical protein
MCLSWFIFEIKLDTGIKNISIMKWINVFGLNALQVPNKKE